MNQCSNDSRPWMVVVTLYTIPCYFKYYQLSNDEMPRMIGGPHVRSVFFKIDVTLKRSTRIVGWKQCSIRNIAKQLHDEFLFPKRKRLQSNYCDDLQLIIQIFTHNIIQLNHRVGWGWELYFMDVCLSIFVGEENGAHMHMAMRIVGLPTCTTHYVTCSLPTHAGRGRL